MLTATINAKNVYEAAQKIQQALQFPIDSIELRIDLFDGISSEINAKTIIGDIKKLQQAFSVPMIFTLRKKSQGGGYNDDEITRLKLIEQLIECKPEPAYLDLEYDVAKIAPEFIANIHQRHPNLQLICSYHNFHNTPTDDDLEILLKSMIKKEFSIYKIATWANSTIDALRLLNFAWQQQNHHLKICVISMGEMGILTRILAPIINNAINYVALDNSQITAPGQLDLKTLFETYNYSHLNCNIPFVNEFLGFGTNRPEQFGISARRARSECAEHICSYVSTRASAQQSETKLQEQFCPRRKPRPEGREAGLRSAKPKCEGYTSIYALLGDPVDHSIGHIFHNQKFRELNKNAVYLKMQLREDEQELTAFFHLIKYSLSALPFRGFSVTMPLKEKIMPYLDDLHEDARLIGAVNTIVIKNGKYIGYNTDGIGVLNLVVKAVRANFKGQQEVMGDKKIVIIGAGGTARAIAYEAVKGGAKVMIVNRTKERAVSLAAQITASISSNSCCVGYSIEEFNSNINASISIDIVINATPLGMANLGNTTEQQTEQQQVLEQNQLLSLFERIILPCHIVCDVVISASTTALLKIAHSKKCVCITGQEVFVSQAIEQERIWFAD